MRVHYVLRQQSISFFIWPVQQDENEIEARQERSFHFQVLSHRTTAVIVAAARVGSSSDGRPCIEVAHDTCSVRSRPNAPLTRLQRQLLLIVEVVSQA